MNWSDTVAAQGRLLYDAARAAPDARVPACPDFDATKLARHVGFIFERVALALGADATAPADGGPDASPFRRDDALPAPPPADEVFERLPAALDRLVAALAAADPATPMWTLPGGDGTATAWARRMAHESTVHRVDAEQAAGWPVSPIDPDLAVDGVAELLDRVAHTSAGDGGATSTVHLHATDVEGEWLVAFDTGGVTVTTGHAKGDAAVRGPAAELYLWLWGRRPLDGLEVFGDPAAADRLRRAATL